MSRKEVQVEDDIGDLDDTQVAEPGSKRYKEDSVCKGYVVRCAEDAACRATSEMNAITSRLLQDAAVRDQRMAERDAAMAERDAASAEKLADLVKAVSESVDSKISNLSASVDGKLDNLEQRVQEQWKRFENRWMGKWCNRVTKRLQSLKRNTIFGLRCKEMPMKDGRTAWPTKTRSLRTLLRCCART